MTRMLFLNQLRGSSAAVTMWHWLHFRRLTPGLRLSQRCVSLLGSKQNIHGCNNACTVTTMIEMRPPDQNKYVTKVLMRSAVLRSIGGKLVIVLPFSWQQNLPVVWPVRVMTPRVVHSNDPNALWANEPLLWLLLSKLITTVEKGDGSHFLFCCWSLTSEWGLGLIVWSKVVPKEQSTAV